MEKSHDNQPPPEREPSEADFLADQAAAAGRALSDTLERMRAELGDSADLAAWTRRYPWPTMGVAAAAGFLTVMAISSPGAARGGESSAAGLDADSPDGLSQSRHPRGGRFSDKDRGLFYSLLSELLRNFATAAQGALLAAIGARFQSPVATPDPSPPVADPTVVGTNDGNGFAPTET